MNFLSNADAYYTIVYYIAIGSFVIFVLQSLLTFFGGDIHDGTGADFDGDLSGHGSPFQYFTFRNLVNFLLGFSWTAVAMYDTVANKLLLSILSLCVGIGLVAIVLTMMRQLLRLTKDNTMKYTNAIGKSAEVYLTIPGRSTGKGKIHVSVQGTLRELDAMTEGEAIASGSYVKVIGLIENSILLVKQN